VIIKAKATPEYVESLHKNAIPPALEFSKTTILSGFVE
jgi:hypothetical protein